jgi:hypothetical protein
MTMTAEELRVAIAKAKELYVPACEEAHENGYDYTSYLDIFIPDWPTDMNAAYELEAEVPEEERDKYLATLWMIGTREEWWLVHATAEQRCRAWLIWRKSTNCVGDMTKKDGEG